jgi:hypothetical protein
MQLPPFHLPSNGNSMRQCSARRSNLTKNKSVSADLCISPATFRPKCYLAWYLVRLRYETVLLWPRTRLQGVHFEWCAFYLRCPLCLDSEQVLRRTEMSRSVRTGSPKTSFEHSRRQLDLGGPASALTRLSVGDTMARAKDLSFAILGKFPDFRGGRQAANQSG